MDFHDGKFLGGVFVDVHLFLIVSQR
jgi:hypothetical protein